MRIESATTVPTCCFATSADADGFLCHCAKVAEETVRNAITGAGAATVSEVIDATGAGSGCRACHCRIRRVLGGLPARCGGRFDWCHQCGCIGAICRCEAA